MKKILAVVLAAALFLTFFAFGNLAKGLKDSFVDDLKTSDKQPDTTPNKTDSEINRSEPAPEAVESKATPKPVKVRTKPARTSPIPSPEKPEITPESEKPESTPESEKPAASPAPVDPESTPKSIKVRTKPAKTSPSPSPRPEKSGTAQSSPQKTNSSSDAPTVKPTQPPSVSKSATEAAPQVISAPDYACVPVKITKSPTGETVYEGGGASFVSRAEYCTDIDWLIVNPNGTDFIDASALAGAMPGLGISGADTDTLTIAHIPLSLNGWYVQAKFYGVGGPVHSGMARITVLPHTLSVTGDTWDFRYFGDFYTSRYGTYYDPAVNGPYKWW